MFADQQKPSLSIFQDWNNNRGNFKARLIMVFYRISSVVYRYKVLRYLFFWYLLIYKFAIGWLMNVGINSSASIGKGLKIQYGFGTVIGHNTIIGDNCCIRQLTSISSKIKENGSCTEAPVIGNNVDIGINVVILGAVRIGNNVTIGAGSVITKDVEDNCVMVGGAAVLLKKKYIIAVEGA
ncbi:serine O-acetyltransferase [Pedobacter sandarakinus]|uniref:serine O-acetyltransferase n=1 Tax=Pedobacter sandarakinus TaxID=353156 RepID=UPI002245C6B9|nr:serine acetyltransferase [Pedobacter sandarakinus]MCX2574869.1 serine acetyltransferase [Pedobacter sandarakinus]